MVNPYTRYLLPWLTDKVCSQSPFTRQRARTIPLARGRVLEIGVGSGLNLPFYDFTQITGLVGLDPSGISLDQIPKRYPHIPLRRLRASAETIPLADNSMDTVTVTYTLCTIPNLDRALAEIHRVLTSNGRLLFCEHGLSPDPGVRRWQHGLTPLWRPLAGGCHLNRDIPKLLTRAGFSLVRMDQNYLPGWRPGTYNFMGLARPIPFCHPQKGASQSRPVKG